MNLCPFATQDRDDAHDAGGFLGGPPRGVLHTTEGSNFEGARDAYVENNSWPHFTVTFEGGKFEVFQHLPIDVAARSLQHPDGTVETNRQHAIQIEIVGRAQDARNFSEAYLDGIARLMRWIEENAGVERSATVKFNRVGEEKRLSDSDWLSYNGWCGHQHVPHNEHEDPGLIDIDHLLNTGSNTKANWILIARGDDGKPAISAMNGGIPVATLEDNLKTNLIGFLNRFPKAGTFLVAKPTKINDSDGEIEAAALLPRGSSDTSGIMSAPPPASWLQFCRGKDNDLPIVVAMDGASPVEFYRGNLKQELIEFLNRHSGANTFQVAPVINLIPTDVPEWKSGQVMIPTGRRVMLEVGHGPEVGGGFDPGSTAHDGITTEHALNIIAADAARKVLTEAGVLCTVIDLPQSNKLSLLGLNASGFDVFCSIHHNALTSNQNQAQGSEAFSHSTKGGDKDEQLAALIAAELSKTLNIPNRGAKKASLGVLSGAEDTNVKAAVLAEVYFIDFVGGTVAGMSLSKPNLKDFSTFGGEAIGRAILEWLKKNP